MEKYGSAKTPPPQPVQTLDELILITHGDFKFDKNLDSHFYEADICMQSIKQCRKNYAIAAFVHHNSSRKYGQKEPSFYRCRKYFKNKYRDKLPIVTTYDTIK